MRENTRGERERECVSEREKRRGGREGATDMERERG